MDKERDSINKGLKFIVKSSLIVFIGVFLSKLLTYVYRIIIARHFGPEIYGLYSLASIVLGLFVVFSSIGLTDGLMRFVSFYRGKKQTDKIRYLLKTITIILFISSTIFAGLLFLLSEFISINLFHNENLTIFLKIFSILIPVTVFSYIFLNILRAFEKIGLYSFIWNVLQNLVKVITLILLIFLGLKTNAVIFSYFLGILSMLLVAYFLCRYKLSEIFVAHKLKKQNKNKIIREVFSYSWPIMFTGLVGTMLYWIDSFLLGYFMGAINVGIYNAATPLIGLMAFIPSMFTQLFFPLIIKEFSKKNYGVINELSKQVGKWILILNLPLFLIMITFPGTLIALFFGESYLAASSALRILAVGGFISSLVFLSTDLISMIGKSKLILINILGASFLNILLNFILIPKYGLNGAAIATSAVITLLSIILLCEVKYHLKIVPTKKKTLHIFLVSLIPLLLVLLIKQYMQTNLLTLILLGTFFILSYICLLLVTKSLDKNDIFILKAIKNKLSKKS
jgi:O-antigen/teichoic acid export membrane protein